MQTFETQVVLPAPIETVFDFIARPENIRKISPPQMGLSFQQAPERISAGVQIAFSLQAFGISRSAVHEIIQFDEPRSFFERQVTGPFGNWEHEHLFESDAQGRVIVTDRIRFEPPGGMLRLVMTPKLILEQLEDGFDHRYGQLERIFGRV